MPILKPGEQQTQFASREGLGVLQSLLGFYGTPSDVVLVSIDMEVCRGERGKSVLCKGFPDVRECGIATLDTREIERANTPSGQVKIRTKQFSTSHSSSDFLDCDVTDFQECVFSETVHVAPRRLAAAIKKCLQIQDERTESRTFRDVAVIGHSPASDLRILCRIGVDVSKMPNVVALLDTHRMAQHLEEQSIKRFSLGGLLEAFHLPFDRNELHNAGNDATYTIYIALAMITMESGGVALDPNRNLLVARLREVIDGLTTVPKLVPIRKSLGAHVAV